MSSSRLDRRAFMNWVSALPLLGSIAADSLIQRARAATGAAPANIYTRIGVRPFINARGTWTYLSGSLELPEVRAAKQEAARHFVDIFELQRGVGKRLAELSGCESGMVTSGAANAMSLATASCMAGTDPEKVWQLPDTTGARRATASAATYVSDEYRHSRTKTIPPAAIRKHPTSTHPQQNSATNAEPRAIWRGFSRRVGCGRPKPKASPKPTSSPGSSKRLSAPGLVRSISASASIQAAAIP